MLESATGFASRHALLLIVGLGAVLRFATLDVQGFWLDEQATLDVIEGHGEGSGLVDVLRSVQFGESNPPVYYILLSFWEKVFGSGEVGIRSLSALAGTAAIPVVYLATTALGTRRAGLIAAAITATSPMLIWYSQEARNYELLVLLGALSFLCFARALDESGHRWLFSWGLVSALALSTHYFAIALIVPEVILLLWRRPGPRARHLLRDGHDRRGGDRPAAAGGDAARQGQLDRRVRLRRPLTPGARALPHRALRPLAADLAARDRRRRRRGRLRDRSHDRSHPDRDRLRSRGGRRLPPADHGRRRATTTSSPATCSASGPLSSLAWRSRSEPAPTGRLGTGVAIALCAAGVGLVIWSAATPAAQRPDYRPLAAELEGNGEERLLDLADELQLAAPSLPAGPAHRHGR